jgi:hypothetical protein
MPLHMMFAPAQVLRGRLDENAPDSFPEELTEVSQIPGEKMGGSRRDRGSKNGSVLLCYLDSGRERSFTALRRDADSLEKRLEAAPSLRVRQIPARLLRGVGGRENLVG